MSTLDEPNGNVLSWRVNSLSETVGKLMDWRREIDITQERQDGRIQDVEEGQLRIERKLDRLTFSVVTSALTLSFSLIATSVAVLIGTGHL